MGKPGLELLLSHGYINDAEAERRSREHELKPGTLDHEMLIADVHVALDIACRESPFKLITWEEGESIRDSFEGGGLAPQKIVVQPDALFQLKDTRLPEGQNCRTYFLEVDRSTMLVKPRAGSQRFRDKIERYRWFIDQSRPFQRHGVRSVRIVTLTLTNARRDNLCADTDAFLCDNDVTRLRKFFLFGSLKDVDLLNPGTILDAVFKRPGESTVYPLFPALAEMRGSA